MRSLNELMESAAGIADTIVSLTAGEPKDTLEGLVNQGLMLLARDVRDLCALIAQPQAEVVRHEWHPAAAPVPQPPQQQPEIAPDVLADMRQSWIESSSIVWYAPTSYHETWLCGVTICPAGRGWAESGKATMYASVREGLAAAIEAARERMAREDAETAPAAVTLCPTCAHLHAPGSRCPHIDDYGTACACGTTAAEMGMEAQYTDGPQFDAVCERASFMESAGDQLASNPL